MPDRKIDPFLIERQTPQSMLAFATGPHWSGALEIGDASWQLPGYPPLAGGQLTARHDRALTVLTAGIAITIFLAYILASQAATRANSHWRTDVFWSLLRPTF
jgi:hypothetical protein